MLRGLKKIYIAKHIVEKDKIIPIKLWKNEWYCKRLLSLMNNRPFECSVFIPLSCNSDKNQITS